MGYRSLARKKSNLRRAGGWQVQTLDLLILFILVFYLNKLTEKRSHFFEIFSQFSCIYNRIKFTKNILKIKINFGIRIICIIFASLNQNN